MDTRRCLLATVAAVALELGGAVAAPAYAHDTHIAAHGTAEAPLDIVRRADE